MTLITVLTVSLLLLLIVTIPAWSYSKTWGYWTGGTIGLLLSVVLMLALASRI